MKNIQVIDNAENCVYDIFAATDDEFAQIFAEGEDIAFIDEVIARRGDEEVSRTFEAIWKRRVPKVRAMGIHGVLFYDLPAKKRYYPRRRDEEAANPDGSNLRASRP